MGVQWKINLVIVFARYLLSCCRLKYIPHRKGLWVHDALGPRMVPLQPSWAQRYFAIRDVNLVHATSTSTTGMWTSTSSTVYSMCTSGPMDLEHIFHYMPKASMSIYEKSVIQWKYCFSPKIDILDFSMAEMWTSWKINSCIRYNTEELKMHCNIVLVFLSTERTNWKRRPLTCSRCTAQGYAACVVYIQQATYPYPACLKWVKWRTAETAVTHTNTVKLEQKPEVKTTSLLREHGSSWESPQFGNNENLQHNGLVYDTDFNNG